jgi:hypothetical protein
MQKVNPGQRKSQHWSTEKSTINTGQSQRSTLRLTWHCADVAVACLGLTWHPGGVTHGREEV